MVIPNTIKGGSILVISEDEPAFNERVTWLKTLPDGTAEFYVPDGGKWEKIFAIPAASPIGHTHPELKAGISGKHTIPGVGTLVFKKGILTGFTPA